MIRTLQTAMGAIPARAGSSSVGSSSPARRRAGFAMPATFAFCLLLLPASDVRGDVGVPQRFLEPASVEEAWNVIRLATANVERLLEERRPLEIPEQISLCSPALRVLARSPVAPKRLALLDGQVATAFRGVNQVASESMADNITGAEASYSTLRKVLDDLALGYPEDVVKGELWHCVNHPEVVSAQGGVRCEKCQRKLAPRRIPYSFIHVTVDDPVLELAVEPAPIQAAGGEVQAALRLTHAKGGAPVASEDLLVVHGLPLRVLATGPEVLDFHQLDPEPAAPGEWKVRFKPAYGGTYRLWVSAVPAATALQEHHSADVKCGGPPPPISTAPPAETTLAKSGGFYFELTTPSGQGFPLRARQVRMLRLQVTDEARQPVKRLEPIMNAFAHLTGFYADNRTMVELHPSGGEVLRQELRGGPFLGFKFYPPRAGFIRFFCQVQIDGQPVTAEFGLHIAE